MGRGKIRRLIASCGLWGATLLGVSSIHAAGGDTTAERQKHFADGKVAAVKKDWAKAYAEFNEAFRLAPLDKPQIRAQVAIRLGEAAMELGWHREAAQALSVFLREGKPLPADKKQAELWLAQAKQKVGTIKVVVEEKGGDVNVDGATVGKAPLKIEVFVEAGKHRADAQLGTCASKREFYVAIGETKAVTLDCTTPVIVEPAPATSATASAKPVETVAPQVTAAPTVTPPPTATAIVPTSTATVTTAPTGPGPDATPSKLPRIPIVIAGAGIAVAGLAIGAVGIGIGAGKEGEMTAIRDRANSRGAYSQAELDAVKKLDADRVTMTNLGGTGFVVGGVAAAATIVFFVVTMPKGEKKDEKVSVKVAPAMNGVWVSGSW